MRRRGMARVLLLVLAAWLLPGGGGVRAQNNTRPEFSMDAPTIEAPFEYVKHQILVNGEVDGRRVLTLLVDIGAAMPVFDRSVRLVGTRLPDRTIREADGHSSATTVTLDELTIGQDGQCVHGRRLDGLVSDLSQVSSRVGRRIDGIVGLSYLAGFIVEIDYTKRCLRFFPPKRFSIASCKPNNQSSFLLPVHTSDSTQDTSSLSISGKLAGSYDYEFILDTGFRGYVSISRSDAELSGLLKRDTPRTLGESFSVSHRFRIEKIRTDFLMLGEIHLSNRIVQVDTRNGDGYGQHGIIGNRLLQNYRMTLDCARRLIWLERTTTKEEPDETEKARLGLTVRIDSGSIYVERVAHGSPAERAGVSAGDEILKIDGLPVETIGLATALSVLASPDGPTDLEVKRESKDASSRSERLTLKVVPLPTLDWPAG